MSIFFSLQRTKWCFMMNMTECTGCIFSSSVQPMQFHKWAKNDIFIKLQRTKWCSVTDTTAYSLPPKMVQRMWNPSRWVWFSFQLSRLSHAAFSHGVPPGVCGRGRPAVLPGTAYGRGFLWGQAVWGFCNQRENKLTQISLIMFSSCHTDCSRVSKRQVAQGV